MITQIKGKLVEKNPTQVVVDCNGIGYEINISLYTFSSLSSDENIKLFTHLQVREDAHILYGFFSVLERAVFRLLISVSGIGTSTARTMLSSLTPVEIQQAIGTEDVATIQGVKGIGLKTAQRVIIELKDKIKSLQGADEIPVFKSNTIKEETLSALEVLGYSRKASEKVVDKLIQGAPDSSVEELIKSALNKL
ncbi:Holliday junction branch migration protein RuvA [Flavobacteriaceae bacterium]|nr:Holliday junction branch migration protein RuvA [Flavobacteriaceae bacterium]MDA8763635.1 Holliday junction branch migration protein RuvA [Flavobacteriaceae bacterium]MDB2314469.1 Holliday junction branch migration protein RuvA [Flavobacteriaceae bacterium]MDC0479064.1 Holliday junction branch migration protein RuvA [Flavobacteriaceae bacterium]MDC3239006.1 Holliday junction branch migration protein RuvA [Flavobacteriaceae bacterium]|tara:strand:+ start:4048 stop:4629 length:582 start_codon:yes stop_codon:yes gene_type:complete